MLATSEKALCERYDLAMLDLDGVVYIGGEAIPGVADHLDRARSAGMRLGFVTNNASRPPEEVAAHLRRLGVAAETADVVTSAQAAARVLADRFGEDSPVVCLGAAGLEAALRERGLRPVGPDDEAVAIATGYGPDVPWSAVMRAAVRIRDGLPWVASNTDHTIPTPYGVAPGHGVQVAMLRDFAGVEPTVAGKPARPLLEETIRRVGGRRPLMIGDRLDTDIEGAAAVGVDSLLVLTGVTGLPELVSALPPQRPTYLAVDLRGLLEPQEAPQAHGTEHRLGGWVATTADGVLAVSGAGSTADWWRVVAAAAWRHLDDTGACVDLAAATPPVDE